jgi:hypothetical protein
MGARGRGTRGMYARGAVNGQHDARLVAHGSEDWRDDLDSMLPAWERMTMRTIHAIHSRDDARMTNRERKYNHDARQNRARKGI